MAIRSNKDLVGTLIAGVLFVGVVAAFNTGCAYEATDGGAEPAAQGASLDETPADGGADSGAQAEQSPNEGAAKENGGGDPWNGLSNSPRGGGAMGGSGSAKTGPRPQ